MQNKLGGTLAGTGGWKWPKGYSTPQNSCPVYKLGEVTRNASNLGSGEGSGVGQQGVSNCIIQHFFFPFCYHLPLLLYFTLFLIIKLFLSQSTSFTLILSPIPLGCVGGEKKLREWLLNFQLGLNHDTISYPDFLVLFRRKRRDFKKSLRSVYQLLKITFEREFSSLWQKYSVRYTPLSFSKRNYHDLQSKITLN